MINDVGLIKDRPSDTILIRQTTPNMLKTQADCKGNLFTYFSHFLFHLYCCFLLHQTVGC